MGVAVIGVARGIPDGRVSADADWWAVADGEPNGAVVHPQQAGVGVEPDVALVDGFAVVVFVWLRTTVGLRVDDDGAAATCCTALTATAAGGWDFEVGEEEPVAVYFLEDRQQCAGDVEV